MTYTGANLVAITEEMHWGELGGEDKPAESKAQHEGESGLSPVQDQETPKKAEEEKAEAKEQADATETANESSTTVPSAGDEDWLNWS